MIWTESAGHLIKLHAFEGSIKGPCTYGTVLLILSIWACSASTAGTTQDVEPSKLAVRLLPQPSPSASSLPAGPIQRLRKSITAMARTPDGSLWYAYDKFDGVGGVLPGAVPGGLFRQKYGHTSYYGVPRTIRVLEVGPDGALYIGAGCGLLRFRQEQLETLAEIDCERSVFKALFPFDLAFDKDGRVWVGGVHGLASFDGKVWTEYDVPARRLLVAPDGSIWAEGWDGQAGSDCCFSHLSNNRWMTYTHSAPLRVPPELADSIRELQR